MAACVCPNSWADESFINGKRPVPAPSNMPASVDELDAAK